MEKKYVVKNLTNGTYLLSNAEGWGTRNLCGNFTPHLFATYESAEWHIENQPNGVFQIQEVYVK